MTVPLSVEISWGPGGVSGYLHVRGRAVRAPRRHAAQRYLWMLRVTSRRDRNWVAYSMSGWSCLPVARDGPEMASLRREVRIARLAAVGSYVLVVALAVIAAHLRATQA